MRITIDDIPDEIAQEIATGLIALVAQHTPVQLAEHKAVVMSLTPEWTPDRAAAFMRDIPAMADRIVRLAAANNGWADASELRGPEGEDSLRGQTTAITKAVKRGARKSLWPEGMQVPVSATYDANVQSYQRTSGFSMPAELVPIFQDAIRRLDK
ncbi:hypothetical protein [Streptomyces sp. NPDC051994]|uniref:hypothetical protein n=1 Tax=unclassified Streptomyces TaxID=2593676 RepID=UPI003448D069